MSKVLIMIRTSTEVQSIEDQKKEMIDFCKAEGYAEEDIVCVDKQGASAAKVDDEYREMIDEVKRKVEEDPDIKCFAVWHLNRLARTEEVWVEVKSFFVQRKVQIICKNPYLKLLAPDGSVDPGMELAMGLLAILSKQEQAERKAKFRRAKKANAAKGKYIGGNTIPYGYGLDENLFFIEKPEESVVIKTAFELYSTGKYSTYTLSKELEERGYEVSDYTLCRMLRNKAYIGEDVGDKYPIHYPPIISKELFDAVEKVRNANKLDMKKNANPLGAKLVRCYKCGAVCTSNSRHYVCCRHMHHGQCDNGVVLRQCVVDEVLWRVAYTRHMEYLLNLNNEMADEYRKEIAVLEQKIAAVQVKIDKIEEKRNRIIESYMAMFIDAKTRDSRLAKVNAEAESHLKAKTLLQEKRDRIEEILKSLLEDMDVESAYATATLADYSHQEKYNIIHKHIQKITGQQQSFGERDPRTHLPNGVELIVTDIHDAEWKFMYVPKFYKKHNLYVWNGREWVADMVEITDKKTTPSASAPSE